MPGKAKAGGSKKRGKMARVSDLQKALEIGRDQAYDLAKRVPHIKNGRVILIAWPTIDRLLAGEIAA